MIYLFNLLTVILGSFNILLILLSVCGQLQAKKLRAQTHDDRDGIEQLARSTARRDDELW